MANYYNARLAGQFTVDPHLSFMHHLKSNWRSGTSPPSALPAADKIKFDTKWAKGQYLNFIIVKFTGQTIEPQTLGAGRGHFVNNYLVQVAARGFASINTTFLMMEEITRIVNGDPASIQNVTIDTVATATGLDWAWIDGFQDMNPTESAKIIQGEMPSQEETFSWYKASAKTYFDKYRA